MTLTELILKYSGEIPNMEICFFCGTYEWPKGQLQPYFRIRVSCAHPEPNGSRRMFEQTVSGQAALNVAGDHMLAQLEVCLEDLKAQES